MKSMTFVDFLKGTETIYLHIQSFTKLVLNGSHSDVDFHAQLYHSISLVFNQKTNTQRPWFDNDAFLFL